MSKFIYTTEQNEWIKKFYNHYEKNELYKHFSSKFNFESSFDSFYNHCKRIGARLGSRNPVEYSREEKEWIKENFPHFHNGEFYKRFTERFGNSHTSESVERTGSKICGRKEKSVAESHDYNSYDDYEERLVFLKGKNVPFVKIPKGKAENYGRKGREKCWIKKADYIWTNEYGKIPDNSVVIVLDGDETNCELENLALVDRKEMSFLITNKLLNGNPEVIKTAIGLCKYIKTIKGVLNNDF